MYEANGPCGVSAPAARENDPVRKKSTMTGADLPFLTVCLILGGGRFMAEFAKAVNPEHPGFPGGGRTNLWDALHIF